MRMTIEKTSKASVLVVIVGNRKKKLCLVPLKEL